MQLYKLVVLRLKAYFRKPCLILVLAGFLMVMWAMLNFTHIKPIETLVLPIGVVDLDQTKYSNLIIQRMEKKNTISIETTSQDEALKLVSTGKLEAVYILKEGLMDQVIDGDIEEVIEIVKSPVSLSAEIIGELFSAEVMRLASNADAAHSVVRQHGSLALNKDKLWQEAWALTDGYWEPTPIITTLYHSTSKNMASKGENQELTKIKDNMAEGLLLTLLIFSILTASCSLLTEKNNGIIKRIISTGTPLWAYLLSNVLTILTIHTIGLFMVMISSTQVNLLSANFALYGMYMIWACTLGMAMVAFAKKMQQLLIIVPFITFCNSLLIWKLQGYNSFGSSVSLLVFLSISMLVMAIKSFNNHIS